MTEMRRDPVLGRWVIVENEESSLGPQDYEKQDQSRSHAEICPFCPHKEGQTPPEVDAIRNDGSQPNGPGWDARVVPNKFPALRIEGELDKRGEGMYDQSNGIGAHEVVIETADHFRDLADLSVEEVVNVLRLYQNRSLSLAKDKRFKYIQIFKNYGESAGTSSEHAHSQIIALPTIPKYVNEKLDGAKSYYMFRERCLFCDMIDQEVEEKERVVTENEAFIALCPFVPRYPFETWIFPKEHQSSFCSLDDGGRYHLAAILKETLLRVKVALFDPSYNFYLHVAPVNYKEQEAFHWHIEVVPQLCREVGYEWGTGLYRVRTSPSVAAGHLRGAKLA